MTKKLVVLILAGGAGRRFWPITVDKLLLPFCGSSFFSYAVTRALPESVSKIVIVANRENRKILLSQRFPLPHVVVHQPNALGMADAILTAGSELEGQSLLILIADDLLDKEFSAQILAHAKSTRAFGVIPGWIPPHYFSGGYLTIDRNRVRGIVEKPGEGNEPSPYVNVSGHYISDADLLLRILKQTGNADDAYEKALTTLMRQKEFVMVPYNGPFASLKYPWNVLDVMRDILSDIPSRKEKNVDIGENVHIEGNVWFGDNVRVHENSKIIGPAYIGDGTIIGSNNIIRHSDIGKNCITGFNTEITRSYIGDGCWFHRNYIGDSVLEGSITMGAGTVVANVRLDDGEIFSSVRDKRLSLRRNKFGAVIGKNVRIGVNTSIMPGIKIGRNSFIGAGIVLDRDIADGQFVTLRQTYTVTRNNKTVAEGKRSEFRKKLTP